MQYDKIAAYMFHSRSGITYTTRKDRVRQVRMLESFEIARDYPKPDSVAKMKNDATEQSTISAAPSVRLVPMNQFRQCRAVSVGERPASPYPWPFSILSV